uniref:Uncharacterized protein n=1 Tax=viral metagenome TaxID=1070528 RepID=A0A6M3JB13_9ZZZZ
MMRSMKGRSQQAYMERLGKKPTSLQEKRALQRLRREYEQLFGPYREEVAGEEEHCTGEAK